MITRKNSRRSTYSAFHEGELARMQHTHELPRADESRRRKTVDLTFTTSFVDLPVLRQCNKTTLHNNKNNNNNNHYSECTKVGKGKGGVGQQRTCASYNVTHRPKKFIDWRNSLRRDILTLPKVRRLAHTHNGCTFHNDLTPKHKENHHNLTLNISESPSGISPSSTTGFTAVIFLNPVISSENNSALISTALETLRRLFLPRWRLYIRLRGIKKASVNTNINTNTNRNIIENQTPVELILRRRSRVREVAVDVILSFLRSERFVALAEFQKLKEDVVKIQRLFRRHKKCLDARVELNFRKLRRDVEQKYWVHVEDTREQELQEALSSARHQNNNKSKKKHNNNYNNHNMSINSSSINSSGIAAAAEDEMDVANFNIAGRMPELLLRRELRSALHCQLHRAVIDKTLKSSQQQQQQQQQQQRQQGQLTVFMPLTLYFAVLDNVCYITSVLRNSYTLRSHLCRRSRTISAY